MVYIAAMAVMVILLSFGLTYMYTARTQIRIGKNEADSMKAFYLAEAGAEYSLAELICNYNDCSTDPEMKNGNELVDLDGDFNPDTEAHYNNPPFMSDPMSIRGRAVWSGPFWGIDAKVNTSGIYGAIVSGGWVYFHHPIGIGMINGNVDGEDSIGPGISIDEAVTVCGTIGEHTGGTFYTSIPQVDFDAYRTWVQNNEPPGHYIVGPTDYTSIAPLPDTTGIYFVDGNLTIDGTGFNLNGTLIVNGNVIINTTQDDILISGLVDHPALVAQAITVGFDVDGTELENLSMGMVYAEESMLFINCKNAVIDGALVSRNSTGWVEVSYFDNFTVDYDTNLALDESFLDEEGTFGYPKIVLWQGFQDD